jgi:hypothetical protein
VSRQLDADQFSRVTERLDDLYSERPSELDAGMAAGQALAIDEDW